MWVVQWLVGWFDTWTKSSVNEEGCYGWSWSGLCSHNQMCCRYISWGGVGVSISKSFPHVMANLCRVADLLLIQFYCTVADLPAVSASHLIWSISHALRLTQSWFFSLLRWMMFGIRKLVVEQTLLMQIVRCMAMVNASLCSGNKWTSLCVPYCEKL